MTSSSATTTEAGAVGPPDVIDQLAGIAPGSPLAALRAERPDIIRYSQGSYLALFEPDDPDELARDEREAAALRVAVLIPDPALADWHRQRLRLLGDDEAAIAAVEHFPNGPATSPRRTALLRHVDRVVRELGHGRREHIAELTEAGFSPRAIVTLSQLIGFVGYQVRALAALRILAEDA